MQRAAVSCLLLISASVCLSSKPPNIIFILADDLGWDDVSFHGSEQVPTPNLDKLASDGIILANYYVQPLCTPSRGSLLTGRHPSQIGLQHFVIVPAEPSGLALNETLLPQYFNQLGYESHMVGKWHLGMFAEEYTPIRRGFKTHNGFYHGRGDYLVHTNEALIGPSEIGLDFWRNGRVDRTGFGQYSTTLFTTEAENIIADHNQTKPLFLYLAHQAVHRGNQGSKDQLYAPWKYRSKFSHIKNKDRAQMAGMLSALDESVGNVTKALHSKGMLNNSVIVFSTDNGAPHFGSEDFTTGSNYPLRGCKNSVWEGGVKGTAFIWSPLLKKSNYVSHHLMHISDWLPTLLEASGYNISTLPSNLYGTSQWQALSQNTASKRTEMLHNYDPMGSDWALRFGDMKLSFGHGQTKKCPGWYQPYSVDVNSKPQGRENHTVPEGRHSDDDLSPILRNIRRGSPAKQQLVIDCGPVPPDVMTSCQIDHKPCLFNITADPCEYHNLADQYPEMVIQLVDRLNDYKRMSVKPISKAIDPAAYPSRHGGVWRPWIKL